MKHTLVLILLALAGLLPAAGQTTVPRWEFPVNVRVYAVNNDDFSPGTAFTLGAGYRVAPRLWLGAETGIEAMSILWFSSYLTLPVMADVQYFPFNGRLSNIGLYADAGHHFWIGSTDTYGLGLEAAASHGPMADFGFIWKKKKNNGTRHGFQIRLGYSFRRYNFNASDGLDPMTRRCVVLGFGGTF